ncbi:olfactory receptor 14A16-like [Mauremys reevesii]|uniref:olfactory receptor 14A16-like n=1 Tax=Mauremys reevesii TaxID=260615 RepID=UPI00193F784A|nr:olfactory receptor 14A16-like [Mauremys reevesii]
MFAISSIKQMELTSHNVLRKKMFNRTTVTEFLLLAFSDVRELQSLHFVVFLMIYLAGLLGNLLIIIAKAFDHDLHTPLYFFLVNQAILDLGSISVTIPKPMVNSLMNTRVISYSGCVTQVFLFMFLGSADLGVLTIMAYDRYVAICQPLQYERVMNRRVCIQMAASAWISGILYSALHTGNTFVISFCGVVSLFIFSGIFAYLKSNSSSTSRLDLVVDVFYSVVPPVMNPIIYSMRNKEIKAALRKLIRQRLFMINKMFIFLL